eukprot:832129-Prorocentrum_lima.AAC.1
MTSSLVGSEMCIRDSRTATRRAEHIPTKFEVWVPGERKDVPYSIFAVSYTHLTLPTICSV